MPLLTAADGPPVEIACADGASGILLVCEHAGNAIPQSLGSLGLTPEARISHAAWDIGARALALELSANWNAPLVAARFSRLVQDCNRPPEAPGAMPARTERIEVPGNAELTDEDRAARTAALYDPFHAALDAQIARIGTPAIVTIHSFTPHWFGTPRDVRFGILSDPRDDRLAQAILARPALPAMTLANAPYGPGDGVFHTLERHALPRGLPNVMIEVRNDLLSHPGAISEVAGILGDLIPAALAQTGSFRGALA